VAGALILNPVPSKNEGTQKESTNHFSISVLAAETNEFKFEVVNTEYEIAWVLQVLFGMLSKRVLQLALYPSPFRTDMQVYHTLMDTLCLQH